MNNNTLKLEFPLKKLTDFTQITINSFNDQIKHSVLIFNRYLRRNSNL